MGDVSQKFWQCGGNVADIGQRMGMYDPNGANVYGKGAYT